MGGKVLAISLTYQSTGYPASRPSRARSSLRTIAAGPKKGHVRSPAVQLEKAMIGAAGKITIGE